MKFMRQLGLGFALGSVLVLSGTLTAQAQKGPTMTDPTGPVITDPTSPVITDPGGPGIDPINTDSNGFSNDAVARVVNRATQRINRQLSRRELKVEGYSLPPQMRQDIRLLFLGGKIPPTMTERVINNIGTPQGGPGVERAEQLVNSLNGILANNKPNAVRLLEAREAYNEVINNSSAEYLNSLPLEVQLIDSVLSTLINTANSAASH